MGDALALDTGLTTELAVTFRRVSERSAELSTDLAVALRTAELPPTSATIVSEVGDECRSLARYLDTVAEEATLADQLGASADGAVWMAAMRADWRRHRDELWLGLNDSVGATGLDRGTFSLANSIVSIDRSAWMRTAIPPGCESYGPDAYYTGGGAVSGPDGRLYPIVIPHVQRGDEHYTIDADLPPDVPSAASLDGNDPGWTVVGYRTGVEQVGGDIGPVWQAAVAMATATGLATGSYIGDDHLAAIELRLGGRPVYAGTAPSARAGSTAATASQAIEPHTGPVVDGRVPGRTYTSPMRTMALPNPPASPKLVAKANLRGNVSSLVIGGLQGVQVALSMDDSKHRAYEVILEENDDGRLRSRVQSFALEPRPDGVLLSAWHLFVGDDGTLRQSPAKYQSVDDNAADEPDDDHLTVVADNSNDPDYAQRVPHAAFDPG